MKIHKKILFTAAALLAFNSAAAAWPDRPIQIIQGFSQGAATQAMALDVGEILKKAYGAEFYVLAKPGAGGIIGTDAAAKAAPDGYTILLGTAGTHAINPALYRELPYDAQKDFEPITLLADLPNVLLVSKDSPFNSVQDLVDYAKARPKTVNYGSSGNGTSMHLAAEQFRVATGIDITHVPYKESAHALTGLIGKQVHMTFHQLPAVLGQIRSGTVKALAITSKNRSPALPDVPTVAESGYPSFESVTWFALFAPAKTPRPVIEKINAAVTAALNHDLGEKIKANGATPRPSTPAELTAAIVKDSAQWKAIVERVGAKLD
ncbi:tripartite tricarboxylate transporter substrate binding protein [Bordetella sp. BOR01]|uniref:Bug family tripartite tricarboxylate transporter substrate binding protein n=1 Tax=Bordetella sp. BOR01 TaxID=2854779 RepID=UPI001C45E7AD|nr:tripartite tricarboxylate transporter substrate binding protein [Bordetella sp. BOR01]MBV7483195.1 tripartite tricarboxylate transporter substrate binding protein [Bordetella sp. BOR01]